MKLTNSFRLKCLHAFLPESRKYVALLIDEMKVKEGLVFNKYSGEI